MPAEQFADRFLIALVSEQLDKPGIASYGVFLIQPGIKISTGCNTS